MIQDSRPDPIVLGLNAASGQPERSLDAARYKDQFLKEAA